MANYVKATNFTAKDTLPSGNSGKIVKGSEIDTELTAVASAIASKADLNSPALTGTPTAPTASPGTNTTQLATTAFVSAADALKADIASPTFTGVPAAPTASPGTSTTQLATTAFVTAADALKANIASPAFTGVPTAPTAAPGTITTQIATTAFVATAIAGGTSALGLGTMSTQNANNVAITGGTISGVSMSGATISGGTISSLSSALAVASGGTGTTTSTGTGSVVLSASPAFTGTPTAPTAGAGTNTTQLATTAFVTSAISTATSALGTMSSQNANSVSISGGSITGITDLAVADGGTGASSFTANSVLLGNGTSAFQTVAPGTNKYALRSTGTTFTMQQLGLGMSGEVWNNVTGSRAFGVTYTNSRSYPIAVSANTGASGPSPYVEVVVDGIRTSYFLWQFNGAGAIGGASPVIVPPGSTYQLNANAGLNYWAELY